MRIDGEWLLCDDGVRRPIIRGEILTGYGSWEPAEFLIDTGADRTVFTASLLAVLRLQATVPQHRLGSVGGLADAVVVETQIRFNHEEARKVVFRGQYAAVTSLEILDISVLGGILPVSLQSLSISLAISSAYSGKGINTPSCNADGSVSELCYFQMGGVLERTGDVHTSTHCG
jgi:hypothetical protein